MTEKEYIYMCIYIYVYIHIHILSHFAIQQKLTENCKSTITEKIKSLPKKKSSEKLLKKKNIKKNK